MHASVIQYIHSSTINRAHTYLSNGVDFVSSAPETAVHGVELEELQGILDALHSAVAGVRLYHNVN